MRYALINSNNEVENIVLWDGVTEVEWPNGCTPVLATAEHEAEFNAKNAPAPSEQGQLSDEEMELLRSLLNRINSNG
jgi:hypothetical protein